MKQKTLDYIHNNAFPNYEQPIVIKVAHQKCDKTICRCIKPCPICACNAKETKAFVRPISI